MPGTIPLTATGGRKGSVQEMGKKAIRKGGLSCHVIWHLAPATAADLTGWQTEHIAGRTSRLPADNPGLFHGGSAGDAMLSVGGRPEIRPQGRSWQELLFDRIRRLTNAPLVRY